METSSNKRNPLAQDQSAQNDQNRGEQGLNNSPLPLGMPYYAHLQDNKYTWRIDRGGHASGSRPSDVVKKTTAVAVQFRDNKFTGSLEQLIRQTICNYEIFSRQIGMTDTEKKNLFINIIAGAARIFFFGNCSDEINFRQLMKVMLDEYDSEARRLYVQSELEMLTLKKIMSDHQLIEEGAGLAKLVDRINILLPQCPTNFRSESNKVRFI